MQLVTMYHGTSEANAQAIERSGFRPSADGMLGPGVYCTRDINKAKQYGDVVLILLAKVGRVHVISHATQRGKGWQTGPFDSAWVKPGVQQSGEEDCIKDPARIQVIARADPRHTARRAPVVDLN